MPRLWVGANNRPTDRKTGPHERMTDRPAKEVYQKVKRIIRLNTLNKVQGPTVKKTTVKQTICSEYSPEQFETAINALKHNNEILELENTHLTLWDLDRLTELQEQEASKDAPRKELIGHINKMKDKI